MVTKEKQKALECQALQKKLESMTLEDLGRTMFWLTGFMSEKDCWHTFCEGVKSSPYFLGEGIK